MKITYLRMRTLVVALIMFSLTSLNVQAQETDDFLAELHTFRVSNYVSLDAYYRFIGSGGTDILNEIVAGINVANESMNALAQSEGGGLTNKQIQELNSQFEQYKDLMRGNINDVRKLGYPDLRLVSDMANQAQAMNNMATELYKVAQDNSEAKSNARVEAAREGAVKIAQMMAKYSVRTNLTVSQAFQGSTTNTSLDEQARELDQLLATVSSGANGAELKSLLSDVGSKWQFIRGSYINYNENNVGFVIDRYSRQILESLTTAIELLQQKA